MAKVVPVRFTKSSACPRLSRAPTPMRVNLSVLFRANCSRPGASRRQVGQWGAQNHSTMGRSEGAKLARFTVAPVATFTMSTDGRSDSGTGVGSGVGGGGVDSGVGGGGGVTVACGVETAVGVDAGVGLDVEVAAGAEVAAGVEVAAGAEVAVDVGSEVDSGWLGAVVAVASVGSGAGASSGSGSSGDTSMLSSSAAGSTDVVVDVAAVGAGSCDASSGVSARVGAGVWTPASSVTDVSEPPQAAPSKARTRNRPVVVSALDRWPKQNACLLTLPMLSLTISKMDSDSNRVGG